MEEMQALVSPRASANVIPRKPLPTPMLSNHQPSVVAQEDGEASSEDGDLTRQKNPRKTRRRCTQSTMDVIWLPEITSVLLALIALVATIILLALRGGKPLPDWPSLLNINSLVAIFSAVVKVALLFPIAECISELKWIWFAKPQPVSDFDRFDSASRGPWGALKLLFERPNNILTSLGAAVTILTLAVDPFAQQLLQFHSCLIPVQGASATVARTNNYTAGTLQMSVGTPLVNRQMTAALYSGLLDPPPNASALMSTFCQSGNCTFPHSNNSAYTSLAMCSSIEDISQLISGHGSIGNQSYETWNYTLPSGLRLLGTSVLATADTADTVPLSQADDPGTPLLTLEALMVTVNCSGVKSTSKDECLVRPWAIRASLSPCVHTYGNVSFSDSVFEEYVVSTTMLPFANTTRYYALAGDYPSLPDIDCSPSESAQGKKTQATSLLASGLRYVNHLAKALNGADTLWYDPSCTYEFGYGPTSGLRRAFQEVFFGSIGKPKSVTIPWGLSSQTIGEAWILSLYADGEANLTSVTTYMEGLATSMTAAIRVGGESSSSAPARGTVLGIQTCVGVQWAWLAFPVVLLLLTLVLLLMTVIQSRKYTRTGAAEDGRKPWKSSSLPLLWCGMGDETRAKYGRFDEIEKMKESGDGVKVSMRRWRWSGYGTLVVDDNSQGRWTLRED
jgi:Protein of unknown function (DUF3176)